MSHTPVLSSGLVIKRKLNSIRPIAGAVPPVGGLQFFWAEVLPIPAATLDPPPTTERADFLTYLSVAGSDGFEVGHVMLDLLNGSSAVANGVTGTFATASPFAWYMAAPFDGMFNTTPAGNFYCQLVFDNGIGGVVPFLITFSTPVAAFGCYFTDIGDFGGTLTITLNISGGGTVVYPVPSFGATSGYLSFWGFVNNDGSTTYDSISIVSNDAAEAVGMDDVVMATTAQVL